jgi:peptide/nickel transport system substrate-binding protein
MIAASALGRRDLIAGAAGIGLGAALGLPARAAEAKPGGQFRMGIGDFATSDSLDPTLSETKFQLNINWQLRNNLVEVAPGGALVPELAESWEGSDGAKRWVFKLRRGVTFHTGKSFGPADVIYSINLSRKEGTHSSAKPFVAPIDDIKATGDMEVTFTLKEGNVGFPGILAMYPLLMVPEGETDWTKGVGTGGYVLQEWEPGVRALVRRNPNYWKAGRAHFDSIEMFGIKDSSARSSALLGGKIDAYNFVDLKTVDFLKADKRVRILRVPGKAHYVFPMLVDAAPFNDNDVRLAMKYAIDREEMLKRILHGYGSVGNDQPISAAYPFFDPTIEQRVYDPEKAKFLLKKAGKSDLTVQLFVSEVPFAGATDASVLYKEHAAKAGITIEVVKTPEDGYWSDVWTKKPLCASRWSGRLNEDVMIGSTYSGESLRAGWNETRMDDERVNKLLAAARTEADEQKRRQMYSDLQRIIHDDGGAVIYVFADFVDAASDKVAHGELSSDWDLDGGRAGERWWFA